MGTEHFTPTVRHGVCFFSSRRRHTRFDCDWSSDVCSSDLAQKRAQRVQQLIQDGRKALNARQFDLAGKTLNEAKLLAPLDPGVQKALQDLDTRSEERRVGEEGRSRWVPYH